MYGPKGNLILITRRAHVPVLAWQEPPGSVERYRTQMEQDVYMNANVSVHMAV
jgi:hypothetical protein